MKKIFYSSLCLFFAAFTIVACNDDDNGPAKSTNPSADAAGKYEGTWTVKVNTKVIDFDGTGSSTTTFDGTDPGYVEISSTGSPYIANIKEQATDQETGLVGENLSYVVNIAAIPDGYNFFNVVGNTTDNTKLMSTMGVGGQIFEDGVLKTNFSLVLKTTEDREIKIGKRTVQQHKTTTKTSEWSFVGKKPE